MDHVKYLTIMYVVNQIRTYINHTRYMQYLTSFLATLSVASSIMYMVWPSPSLPKLTSIDSPLEFRLTAEEASWVVSCSSLGAVTAGTFKIFFAYLFGRRPWLLISGVFLVAPGIIMYFAKSFILLCAAQFMCGLASAMIFTTVPVYIAEIAEKDIRSRLGLASGIMTLCGKVFIFTVGPFISYHNLTLCCIAASLMFLTLFYFMPESPYYLVQIGNETAALDNLTLLSSNSSGEIFVKQRLKDVEETVTYDMKNKSNIWEFISKKEHRRALIIMLGTKGLFQMCGVHIITPYAQTIIQKSNSSISPELSSLLFGVVQFPAVFIASFLVDKAGRRPLWMISLAGCAIAMFGEGICFYLDDVNSIAWLPTTFLILYYVVCPIGVTTLPYVTIGEIFSTNIKGAAVSLSIVYGSVLGFVLIKCYNPIALQFGMHAIFWTFSGFCLLGVVFIFFVVPETKGKSLEEIQQMLNKDRRRDYNLK